VEENVIMSTKQEIMIENKHAPDFQCQSCQESESIVCVIWDALCGDIGFDIIICLCHIWAHSSLFENSAAFH